MKSKIVAGGLQDKIEVDSAGTGDYHVGDLADHRTLETLRTHGIPAPSQARQIRVNDLVAFDYVVAMDGQNLQSIQRLGVASADNLSLMLDWTETLKGQPVPDPYYGSMEDFEHVYELVDSGADGLLAEIRSTGKLG